MIAYIVCEGDFDAALIQRILPDELIREIEVVSAGGLSAVKSLARSLLVRRQVPVAIVADADSVAPELVKERLASIEEIVASVAVNTPIKVILAVPEIESIFFYDTRLLSRVLGYELSPEIWNLAVSQPRKALQLLLSKEQSNSSPVHLIHLLTHEDLETLRTTPVIQELTYFLESVQETAKVF